MARALDELERALLGWDRARSSLNDELRTSTGHLTRRVGAAHRNFSVMYDHNDAISGEIGTLRADSATLNGNIAPTSTALGNTEINTTAIDFRLSEILNKLDKIVNL